MIPLSIVHETSYWAFTLAYTCAERGKPASEVVFKSLATSLKISPSGDISKISKF